MGGSIKGTSKWRVSTRWKSKVLSELLPDGDNSILSDPLLHSPHYPWSAVHPTSIPYYHYNVTFRWSLFQVKARAFCTLQASYWVSPKIGLLLKRARCNRGFLESETYETPSHAGWRSSLERVECPCLLLVFLGLLSNIDYCTRPPRRPFSENERKLRWLLNTVLFMLPHG